MPKVTLYSKPNCPLCDEALEQIEEARKLVAFELEEINILSDEALYNQHKHNMPVVCVDGREVFRYRLTSGELLGHLKVS
jgi:glutaredoxin